MTHRKQDMNDYVPEPLKAIGLTYRQVDYWCRRGYLRPSGDGDGSGNPRWWSPDEIAVALRMADLIAEGYRHEVAATRAREQAVA